MRSLIFAAIAALLFLFNINNCTAQEKGNPASPDKVPERRDPNCNAWISKVHGGMASGDLVPGIVKVGAFSVMPEGLSGARLMIDYLMIEVSGSRGVPSRWRVQDGMSITDKAFNVQPVTTSGQVFLPVATELILKQEEPIVIYVDLSDFVEVGSWIDITLLGIVYSDGQGHQSSLKFRDQSKCTGHLIRKPLPPAGTVSLGRTVNSGTCTVSSGQKGAVLGEWLVSVTSETMMLQQLSYAVHCGNGAPKLSGISFESEVEEHCWIPFLRIFPGIVNYGQELQSMPAILSIAADSKIKIRAVADIPEEATAGESYSMTLHISKVLRCRTGDQIDALMSPIDSEKRVVDGGSF